jgi:hypothetical protein
VPDATFACPDLTTLCRLDEVGLEVTGQRLEAQADPPTGAGCGLVSDNLSGARQTAPLGSLLDYTRRGDTVMVVALDRLPRSLSGSIRTIEILTKNHVPHPGLRFDLRDDPRPFSRPPRVPRGKTVLPVDQEPESPSDPRCVLVRR